MGQYNGVVGGVSAMVTDGFNGWWENYEGTVKVDHADESLTVREAFERALDWEVIAKDVYVNLGDDETPVLTKDPTRLAVVRADVNKILGVHSEGYGIVQNETLADFGEALKTLGDVRAKSAGTLYDDKVAWMLAKLGEDKHFADRDETIAKYLLVATSHDGSIALSARPTNVRVECMNTFDWAVNKSKAIVTLRHTRNVQDYLGQAEQTLREAYNHYDAIDKEIEALMNEIEVSRKDFTDRLVPVLVGEKPDKEGRGQTLWQGRKDGLIAAWDRPDQANIAGTGWGAVMAVNSYENWTQGVRGTTRSEAQARRAVRGDFPLTSKAKNLLLVK